MELVKYKGIEFDKYSYFWVNQEGHIISPSCSSVEEAMYWLMDNPEQEDNIKVI